VPFFILLGEVLAKEKALAFYKGFSGTYLWQDRDLHPALISNKAV
jgi:hypothetical protein